MIILLLLWPTTSSYPSTTLVVLVVRRAFAGANPGIWPSGWTRAQIRGFGRGNELGCKSGGLAERVNSGANPEIRPRGKLGRKFGGLAERASSGANPEIWPRR
ncbi:hypothetical protein B296_00009311 [Ensete ventricosum]|uniref:Uncharacterized protein n=1 Tax=Ensete ventricosum TaxID=4639 RepID=A0A427AZW2_ENSVE|nr:hypothetical protein B296_00009311 [Ensete ventricosum]